MTESNAVAGWRLGKTLKNPFLYLGARTGVLCPLDPGNPPAALSHPRAVICAPALVAALAICAVLGAVSLFVPPFIDWDSANGFLAWRATLLGAVNSIISVDHENIARDTAWFLTVWSPGQYLVPGTISLLGVPLGVAMTLTVALALLASLVGWVMVVRTFAPRTSLAMLVVVLIGSFHYSTHAFSSYLGGEILLQAATPWLVLMAYRIPEMDALPAALLAAVAVFLAFFAKLTGLIVVAAALIAGGIVRLAFGRRVTLGMIGGAVGAVSGLAVLYVGFLSRGPTGVSEATWSLEFRNIAFALLIPWAAGISWSDSLGLIFSTRFAHVPTAFLLLVVPPTLLMARLVLFWRPQATSEKEFRLFSVWFFGVLAAVFILIYIRGSASAGGAMFAEDRYFRSAGTLLFVCALTSALAAETPRRTRGFFLVLCALMTFYGLASFAYHEFTTAKGQSLDRISRTNQRIFDEAAIQFAREAYAQERHDALFVLPSYPLAVAFPIGARILVLDFNYEGDERRIAGRYFGRVPGHVFVLMPNSIQHTSKGRALLSAFADYAPNAWEKRTFADITVYFQ